MNTGPYIIFHAFRHRKFGKLPFAPKGETLWMRRVLELEQDVALESLSPNRPNPEITGV